jgi:hypothetical protein
LATWNGGQHGFLFQLEYELIARIKYNPETILHPFVLMPLCGQLIILYSLFQKIPGRVLTIVGLACLSLIMLMLLLIGTLALNSKIIISSLPFIITGVFVLQKRPDV